MLYHHQPLKGAYLFGQAIAIPFVYVPYWLLTSIPHFFKPPPEEKSRTHAVSRRMRISYLRHIMLVIKKYAQRDLVLIDGLTHIPGLASLRRYQTIHKSLRQSSPALMEPGYLLSRTT